MKRIELRDKHLRISRTSGVALRKQVSAGQFTLTANTNHGIRVSRSIAKGTNVALQNGQLRLRGRYGKGPHKLNLSKSGVSVSTKNRLGTVNWVKPNYSSASLLGVQVRGRKALGLQLAYLFFQLLGFVLFKVPAFVLTKLPPVVAAAAAWLARAGERLAAETRTLIQSAWLRREMKARDVALPRFTAAALSDALAHVVVVWGGGRDSRSASRPSQAGTQLDAFFESLDSEHPQRVVLGTFACLLRQLRRQASDAQLAETFLRADEECLERGGRTAIQDTMIGQFAQVARLALTPLA